MQRVSHAVEETDKSLQVIEKSAMPLKKLFMCGKTCKRQSPYEVFVSMRCGIDKKWGFFLYSWGIFARLTMS
jgi:hypothetical protein